MNGRKRRDELLEKSFDFFLTLGKGHFDIQIITLDLKNQNCERSILLAQDGSIHYSSLSNSILDASKS